VTTLANGSTYAFVNHEFWHLTNNGADEYYPQSTHSVWGIKGKIDAALTYSTHTDLFQVKAMRILLVGRFLACK